MAHARSIRGNIMGNGAKSRIRRERRARTAGRRKSHAGKRASAYREIDTIANDRKRESESLHKDIETLTARCARLKDFQERNEGLAKAAQDVLRENESLRASLTTAQDLLLSIWEEYDLEHPYLNAFVKGF